MKKFLVLTFITLCCSCSSGYKTLNRQAAKEYLEPFRTDVSWNNFAKKFIYAPAFHFDEVQGAESYVFTLTPDGGEALSFKASKPTAPLSPVWDKLPVGKQVDLTVDALAADGKVIARAGERSFLKDFLSRAPTPDRPATTARRRSREHCTSTPCRRSSTGAPLRCRT